MSQIAKEIQDALSKVLSQGRTAEGKHINICCEEEAQEFFKLEREGICRYFMKNQCKKGNNCEFRHEQDQIKAKYKTKLCKNFSDLGYCKFKDQCSYAHGDRELKNLDNDKNRYNNHSSNSP